MQHCRCIGAGVSEPQLQNLAFSSESSLRTRNQNGLFNTKARKGGVGPQARVVWGWAQMAFWHFIVSLQDFGHREESAISNGGCGYCFAPRAAGKAIPWGGFCNKQASAWQLVSFICAPSFPKRGGGNASLLHCRRPATTHPPWGMSLS